jgi:hypothetical protein
MVQFYRLLLILRAPGNLSLRQGSIGTNRLISPLVDHLREGRKTGGAEPSSAVPDPCGTEDGRTTVPPTRDDDAGNDACDLIRN